MKIKLALFTLSLSALPAYACDLCAAHSTLGLQYPSDGAAHLTLSEQYSRYSDLQLEDKKIENLYNEYINSYQTTLRLSNGIGERVAMDISLPVIARTYRQVLADGSTKRSTESGIGDMQLGVTALAYQHDSNGWSSRLALRAAVELPSGKTDRLAVHEHSDQEESEEHHDSGHNSEDMETESHSDHEHGYTRHEGHDHEISSAIHGHDLALGSGSFDFPLSMGFALRYEQFLGQLDVAYTFRTEGDDDYRYGDDLTWSAVLGYFAWLEDEDSLLLGVSLGGEWKEKDKQNGIKDNDTEIRSLVAGPRLEWRIGSRWLADLALELPLDINNSGTQLVMDQRWRLALTYQL